MAPDRVLSTAPGCSKISVSMWYCASLLSCMDFLQQTLRCLDNASFAGRVELPSAEVPVRIGYFITSLCVCFRRWVISAVSIAVAQDPCIPNIA
jgi:hypothetical protein